MIIYSLIEIVLNAISLVLTPFSMVANTLGNVLVDTGFIALLKYFTFFFDKATLLMLLSTFVFWTSIFIARPLVNFIRNRG